MTNAGTFAKISALIAAAIVFCGSCGPADDERTVVYRGNGGAAGSLDPALAQDVHAFNILDDIYEGLVAVSADGRLVPGVAESWDIDDSGLTYRFTLRENARWSNGAPVTAGDFVRSLRRVADPETASAYAFLLQDIRGFADVQAGTAPAAELAVSAPRGDMLTIELSRPTPYFLSLLAMPVALPVYQGDDPGDTATTPDAFVGNGAFVLAAHAPGSATRLSRSPSYWAADTVEIDEVQYLPISDPAAEYAMYRAGQLDITATVPPASVPALREELPDQLRITPMLALYYLAFDTTEPPFDDGRLRQALNMAIDREQLVAIIGRGEQPAHSVVPPGVSGYEGTRFTWADLEPDARKAEARRLFAEIFGVDEEPPSFELLYDTGDIHETVALAVSAMWRDVLGVDVSLRKLEWQYFLATRRDRSAWQVMRFSWFGDYDDATTFTNIFRSGDTQNLSAYANAEFDRLLEAAAEAPDPRTRAQLLAQAETRLLADHPIAPLYFYVSKHLVSTAIAGFEDNVLDRHPSKYLRKNR